MKSLDRQPDSGLQHLYPSTGREDLGGGGRPWSLSGLKTLLETGQTTGSEPNPCVAPEFARRPRSAGNTGRMLIRARHSVTALVAASTLAFAAGCSSDGAPAAPGTVSATTGTAPIGGTSEPATASGAANRSPGQPHPSVRLVMLLAEQQVSSQTWQTAFAATGKYLGLGAATLEPNTRAGQSEQNALIGTYAGQNYGGAIVAPAEPVAATPALAGLMKSGKRVAVLGACPEQASAFDFCLATDAERSAYLATKAAIAAMGGSGTLGHIGDKTTTGAAARATAHQRGVAAAVAETGGKVRLTKTLLLGGEEQVLLKQISDLISNDGPDLQALVVTAERASWASDAAVGFVEYHGYPIALVTTGEAPSVIAGLKQGWVKATVVGNPTAQAAVATDGLTQLLTGCRMKQPGTVLDSGTIVVTKADLTGLDAARQKAVEDLQRTLDSSALTC